MKNYLSILLLILVSTSATAAPSCEGTVISILDWPKQCSGLIAYKVSTNENAWICAKTEKSESLVLMAYAAKANIYVRLNDNVQCSEIENYHIPMYIRIQS